MSPSHFPGQAEPVEPVSEVKLVSGFDWGRLERLADGNQELVQELLQIFVEDSQIYLKTAQTAIANGDWSKLSHAVHQMKGASANVGAIAMTQSAMALETHLRQGEHGGLPALLSQIQAALEEVQKLQVSLN